MGKKSDKTRRKAANKKESRASVGVEAGGNAAEAAVAEHVLSAKDYARELKKLHVELVKLQEWVKHAG